MASIHASALVIHTQGVLIFGESGAGKSSLILEILASQSHFSKLIGDDRLLLEAHHGRLIASSPLAIQGKIEARGLGILEFAFIEKAQIDLLVELSPDPSERMPKPQSHEINGIILPKLTIYQHLPTPQIAKLLTLRIFKSRANEL